MTEYDVLLADLRDLHKQATEDRSHFYTAKCIRRAIAAIERLRDANLALLRDDGDD